MDIKAFPALIVGVVVALVLAGAVLPVFAETTSATDTFKNEGWAYMDKFDPETAEITAFWDHTKPHQITVNGNDIELPIGGGNNNEFSMTVIGAPEFLLRYRSTNANVGGISYYNATGGYHAGTNDSSDMTVTVSGGSITIDNGVNTPITETFTDYVFSVIADKGAYVMKKPTENAYLNGDSEIYGIGRTQIGTGFYSLVMLGTVDNGVSVDIIQANPPTVSNATIVKTDTANYEDLYSFEKITLTATTSDVDYPVTYNQVIVPYEVTAEKTVHPDGPLAVMLNVLPLLAIAGLVTGAVVWFVNRKG